MEANRLRDLANEFREGAKNGIDPTVFRESSKKELTHEDVMRLIEQERIREGAKIDPTIAKESAQKSVAYEEVARLIEQERIREESRWLQEEDVTRLQRVKKWLKENMVGLSAIGITVASLITTIIIGARTVITKGAQATMSFAKAVKDAIAKLGPWATGLANLVYTILKAGSSAISFLARNLWIIVIAVSYFLWEMYENR